MLTGLREIRDASPYLAQIFKAAHAAPFEIVIGPVTDDPRTHFEGDRTRSSTRAFHADPLADSRLPGGPALILLNLDDVSPWGFLYKRGTLAHELVHALDRTYGRSHPNRQVRERRAVFVTNIWRDARGWYVAESYNGEFETLDYQRAKSQGAIQRCLDLILTVSTFDCP